MKLVNRYCTATVQPLGAMLKNCQFLLDGRAVSPLYDAPWRDDLGPSFEALPPIIQGMGSEWPCVPFGRPAGELTLPSEWKACTHVPWDHWAHGYSSNHEWQLDRLSESALRAVILYPEDTPILRLERDIRLLNDKPGISLSLAIHARHTSRFPIGLHPVLSMENTEPETMQLKVSEQARVWSFPIDVEPGSNHFSPNLRNRALNDVAKLRGGTTDIRLMPPEGQTEDILMLTNIDGLAELVNPVQKCITSIKWDPLQFPHCLLWVSNGGRSYYPWSGRVAALGIEPVVSAFDLGLAYSLSEDTPLAKDNLPTSVFVDPKSPLNLTYEISVRSI